MVEVIPRFDVHFREVALMFLNRKDKMRLDNLVDNSSKSLEAIRGELPKWLSNFDVATRDIHTHSDLFFRI